MTTATRRLIKCKRCCCMHITTDQFGLGCVLDPGCWGRWRRWLKWSGGGVSLSPNQATILFRLALVQGSIVSTDELVDWLHGDCENGGPDGAYNVLSVHLNKLRRAPVEAGFPGHVRTSHGRGIELIMLPRPAEQREVAA